MWIRSTQWEALGGDFWCGLLFLTDQKLLDVAMRASSLAPIAVFFFLNEHRYNYLLLFVVTVIV